MKKKPTLILVADGCRARLISHTASNDNVLWKMASRTAALRTSALVSDKPGMSFSSAGPGRHAMAPKTSAHRAAQIKFARRVAKAVEKTLDGADYEKFVMIAPPKALGDLRWELSPAARSRITGELRKDLTGLPDRDVLDHVAKSPVFA